MTTVRVLCWPGMPAAAALEEAGRRLGVQVEAEPVASNERLEQRMGAERFDVVFPSDYLVERLVAQGALIALRTAPEVVDRLAPWARDLPHDPGCRWSVPFAFGTTGFLCAEGFGGATSWAALLDPPAGMRVGMLAEVREVVGAALIAAGHSPNDTGAASLAAARDLLLRQRPAVARYDSDDFVTPVLNGSVVAHQAWSGPAAAAVRAHPGLRYVVPDEGAGLWVTTGAVPAAAPHPEEARALLAELADPALAALTTATEGYATPNDAARERLDLTLRGDAALFPPEDVRRRCTTFHDLGNGEARLQALYDEVLAHVSDSTRSV